MTVNDYTAAPDAEFQELLDRIEREPEAPEAWATVEGRVELAARAIWDSTEGEGSHLAWDDRRVSDLYRNRYRKHALAAVVAIDTGQQTAALRRVLALADELEGIPLFRGVAKVVRSAVAGRP